MRPDIADDVINYIELMRMRAYCMQYEDLQETAEEIEDRMEAARNAVLALPDLKIQTVLWLRYIAFLPIRRIVIDTERSRRTVYKYLKKGIAEIREMNGADQAGKLPEAGSGAAADQ